MQPRFGQIRLLVTDFSACFRFYRDVLNLPIKWDDDGNHIYGSFDIGGGYSIGLFPRDLMADAVGASAKPLHADAQDTTLISFDVDSVDETAAELRAKGVTIIAPPTDHPDWYMRTAHFRDPDGNLVEITSALKG